MPCHAALRRPASRRTLPRHTCSVCCPADVCSEYPDLVLIDYTLPSVLNGNALFYCKRPAGSWACKQLGVLSCLGLHCVANNARLPGSSSTAGSRTAARRSVCGLPVL